MSFVKSTSEMKPQGVYKKENNECGEPVVSLFELKQVEKVWSRFKICENVPNYYF